MEASVKHCVRISMIVLVPLAGCKPSAGDLRTEKYGHKGTEAPLTPFGWWLFAAYQVLHTVILRGLA